MFNTNVKSNKTLITGVIISLFLSGCNGGGGSNNNLLIPSTPDNPVIPPTVIGPSTPIIPPTEIGPSTPIIPPPAIEPSITNKVEKITIGNKEMELKYSLDKNGKLMENSVFIDGVSIEILDKDSIKITENSSPFKDVIITRDGNKIIFFKNDERSTLIVEKTNVSQTNYGDTYVFEYKGKKYHYFNKDNVINITDITNIVSKDQFTAEEIKNILSGQFLADYNRGETDIALSNAQGTTINNGQVISASKQYLYNYGAIDLKSQDSFIGQTIISSGYAFNYGTIEIESDKNSIGQYLGSNFNIAAHMGAYNFGKIKIKSGANNSFIKNEKINGAGVYIKNINSLGVSSAHNYGVIEIDNSSYDKNTNPYYSVGMIADGNKAEVYNFGKISVTGGPENDVFMKGINGGKAFNYGDFIYNGSNITLGNMYSYSGSKYEASNNINLDKGFSIIPEVGKGNSYVQNDFITVNGTISGLENIKSQGVYSVETIERDENGKKVIDLILNKDKNIEDTTDGNLSTMIKNSKLDEFVYYNDSSKFSEYVNKLVSSGETWKLKDIYALEYENLNGYILENSKKIGTNYRTLINSEEISIKGDFNRNFSGVFTEESIPGYKLGVFKDYKKDANLESGLDYNNNSTMVLVSKDLKDRLNLFIGYEKSENKYENGSKLNSDALILGGKYTHPLNFEKTKYNLLTNLNIGFNKMERGESGDRFNDYSFSILNTLSKKIELLGLDSVKGEMGINTTIFGHEKINDTGSNLNIGRDAVIDEKTNLSNAFIVNLDVNKNLNLFSKENLISLNLGVNYEKELMDENRWKDSVKLTALKKSEYSETIKYEKYGKVSGYTELDLNLNSNSSTGVYLKVDSLGYKEIGLNIKLKI